MHPVRQLRLWKLVGLLLTSSLLIGLVLYALKQNINLYFTPTQVSQGQAPMRHEFRMGGYVEKHSLVYFQKPIHVEFLLSDFHHQIRIYYAGILPDLFREGQGVVVEGHLNSQQQFIADQVLAKHDEKYQPPELTKK